MSNQPTDKKGHKIAKACKRFFNNADMLAIVFPIIMMVPNVWLNITENFCLLGKVANIVVPLSLYYLCMSALKRVGLTVLLLFLFILMNMVQLTILYLFGESIIAIDMLINAVTTDSAEASELLGNLTIPIIISNLIYLPLVFWAIYTLCKKLKTTERIRRLCRRWGLIGLVTGIAITIVSMLVWPPFSPARNIYPLNVVSNIVTASKRISESINYHKTSADFRYDAVDTHTADSLGREIHVLFIGETSRSLNWEIFGYERPTNPYLSKRDDLTTYQKAATQSNTTHKCVPLMLTHSIPADFDSIIYRKSIITAFNEAGYHTSVFSCQPKNHSYTQYFADEANNTVYLGGDDRYDHNLADLLAKQIADTTYRKQFIILHGYGSHFNYRDRYKDEDRYFLPDNSFDASVLNRKQLINAYDNSIRYTDRTINDILNALDSADVVSSFIFVSDHGEDLFDDSRERLLHASPVPTYYQLRVPLIFWFSDKYRESFPGVAHNIDANRHEYVAPSQAVFHTLLQIAGINTRYLDPTQSVASDSYAPPAPVYLNDYNEGAPLEQCGIRQQDVELLKADGIL